MSCHRFSSDAFQFLSLGAALDIANAHRWKEILVYEIGNDHKGVVIRRAEPYDDCKIFQVLRFADLDNDQPLAVKNVLYEALQEARLYATE